MRHAIIAAALALATAATPVSVFAGPRDGSFADRRDGERTAPLLLAQRRSCKAASSCEDAVRMWCDGYSGADRDRDGIPCENVCRSRAQVEQIKSKIGC